MLTYAVCSHCDFLRVLGTQALGVQLPERCPNCNSELVVRDDDARFEPAHIGRISRKLLQSRL